MDSDPRGNGQASGQAGLIPVDELVLTYDRARAHLTIGGRCENLALMRSILLQALWEVEMQLRGQAGASIAQQLREAARTQAIVDSVARNPRGPA